MDLLVDVFDHRPGAVLGLALWLSVAACAPEEAARAPTAREVPELSAAALRNATYPSQYIDAGIVRLENGRYEDADLRIVVSLLPEYAVGDLDGDSIPDAAVILATNTGGTGTFEDLVFVMNRAGEPEPAASVFLGDRVPVEHIRILEGRVEVDLTMHGPGDPMCCPTMDVTRQFDFEGGGIVEINPPSDVPDYLP